MRHVTGFACLLILVGATSLMADETAVIDPASITGVRMTAEVDPVDPAWVRCTIDWIHPTDVARVRVHGPAEVASTTLPGSAAENPEGWASQPFRVVAGDRTELLLALAPSVDGRPALLVAERENGSVILQAGLSLKFNGATTEASPQVDFRVRNEVLDNGNGGVLIEHLGPKTATKALVFVEDANNRSILDGPTDCGTTSQIWPLTTFLNVTSAPSGALATAVTVHLTVNHPVMADLQVVFSKEFFTVARYLWNNGPGVNIDQDFTRDVFNHTLPGLGEPVNGTWVLALRDCSAGSTGFLDYWSVLIEYSSASTIDLVADTLSVDPTFVFSGDSVEVDWSGHVAGSGTVGGPFTVGFYLSTDTNITTGDLLLGQVVESAASIPGDTFGESSPGRMFTIPGGTVDGTYYLGAIIDSADVIAETNEGNNVAWSQLDVSIPMASIDLLADSVSTATASVTAGDSIQIAYAGQASGIGTIGGNFSLGFYLSPDATINAGDQLLAQRVGAWATTGGDTFSASGYTVPIPASTTPGTYYLGFWVDDTGVVTETNESNNVAVHHPLTVTGGGGGSGQANLTAMPCSVTPVNAQAGGQVHVIWRAFNTGDADVASLGWGIYLSNDGAIDPGTDTRVRQYNETNWEAGHDSGIRQTAVTLDGGLPDGLYYLGLYLDHGFTVAESNESDNSCSAQFQIGSTVAPPAVTRWLVPAAASAPGFGTSNWKSQISVVNPLNVSRTASLYYVANGSPWPGVLLSGPLTIPPTDRAYFDDVLATLNPASGLLYVVLDAAGPVVTSRTYNLEPGGATFGQGIPAIPFQGVIPPESVVLPMVHTQPGRFHTNLGLVHAAAGNLEVQVQAFNDAGILVGTKSYSHNAAWRQINDVFADMGLGSQILYGGWLRITRTGGTGFWTCYASVVDDLTNDPTYVAPVEVVSP